jgi:phosphoribosylaminoimidazole carboxylase PurE protein
MADNSKPKVGILMGSDSDLDIMAEAEKRLAAFGISCEMRILSAHRTPHETQKYAESAIERGLEAIIVGAGAAAHHAGVVAAALKGLDALLATVQMPGGIPVATMAIGKAGATNAGIFAAEILARKDAALAAKLAQFKQEMTAGVLEKDKKLQSERAKR